MAVATLLLIQGAAWFAPDSAGAAQTEIMDFGYSPDEFSVAVGEAVTWLNTGAQAHTVVADAGSADSFGSPPIEPGGRFSHTFKSPGTVSYHCELHRSMKGVVRVVQRPPTTTTTQPPPESRKQPGAAATTTTRPPTTTSTQLPAAAPTTAATTPPPSTPPRGAAAAQPAAPTSSPSPPPSIGVVVPPPESFPASKQTPSEPPPDDTPPGGPRTASSTATTGEPDGNSEADTAAGMPTGQGSSQSQPRSTTGGWADLPMAVLGAALIAGGASWLVKIRLGQRR